MKSQGWKFSGILGLFMLLMATGAEARDIKTVWLARITGQSQCATKQLTPALSDAIDDLERVDAVVLEAKFGSLTNRFFCNARNCHRNLFHVAKISDESESVDSALRDGWIKVDPKNVASPSLPELAVDHKAKRYEVLPVVVTE